MGSDTEMLDFVRGYREAFSSFDPARYEPYLGDEPTYHADAFLSFDPERFEHLLGVDPLHQVGMTKRTGRQGFLDIAHAGQVLYPEGIASRTHHVLVSDGRTVATLVSMRARTNKGVDYENLYGMVLDVHEGRVVSMVECLDDRVAAQAFDLSALGR